MCCESWRVKDTIPPSISDGEGIMSAENEENDRKEEEKTQDKIIEGLDEDFMPKLAEDIEIQFFKSDERGDFFLVRNPRDKRYVKVHESGKTLMDNLDGTKTIVELGKTAPDIDVLRFVNILAKGGFLSNVEAEKKKEPFYTFKIPLFKSNSPIFARMYKLFTFVSSKPFKRFYALFVGISIILFLMNLPEAFSSVVKAFDINEPLTPLLLIMLMFYVVELAHEFAHTGASYNLGAEPGDVGFVFHFLVGFFYVETPDTRMLSSKDNFNIFIAGPLTSVFAGAICTYIFVFTDFYPEVWGASAFFWHLSTLITLTPFMQTDGYYIAQNFLKFPNMFGHSVRYLKLNVGRLFHIITKKEYEEALKGYTKRELKIMKLFAILMPTQIGVLAYFFFFMAMQADLLAVLQLAPIILSGTQAYGMKAYVILIFLSFGLFLGSVAAGGTLYRFFKQGKERW
ncbi:MAG: hypothetical protein HXS44_16490 [Theionarchaea archaeon]|nr:hypothetical protein [Theionarchaea archaeon]